MSYQFDPARLQTATRVATPSANARPQRLLARRAARAERRAIRGF